MRPRPRLPDPVPHARLSVDQRRIAHMTASVLLDYPSSDRLAAWPMVRAALERLPRELARLTAAFFDDVEGIDEAELQRRYVDTFDLKRKCALYISYYAAGDTRRRGMALVAFIETLRAEGFEVVDDELPDYLPAVLEFSAATGSPRALELLAAHREGIEVLRLALQTMRRPWRHVAELLSRSLPPLDAATQERYRLLVSEGPPQELVGIASNPLFQPYPPTGVRQEVGS